MAQAGVPVPSGWVIVPDAPAMLDVGTGVGTYTIAPPAAPEDAGVSVSVGSDALLLGGAALALWLLLRK